MTTSGSVRISNWTLPQRHEPLVIAISRQSVENGGQSCYAKPSCHLGFELEYSCDCDVAVPGACSSVCGYMRDNPPPHSSIVEYDTVIADVDIE